MANLSMLRAPNRNQYKWLCLPVAALGIFLIFHFWKASLTTKQQAYFRTYVRASMPHFKGDSETLVYSEPQRDYFTVESVKKALRTWKVYDGKDLWDFITFPLTICLCLLIGLLIIADRLDGRRLVRFRAGKYIRGTQMVTVRKFNREYRGDGLEFDVLPTTSKLFERLERNYPLQVAKYYPMIVPRTFRTLRIEAAAECEHFLTLGDTGGGKTQAIQQILDQDEQRDDTTVVLFDSEGYYTSRYYDPDRGDVILNPLDTRSPSWCPTWELDHSNRDLSLAMALAQAESLYPGRLGDKDWFFINTARLIYQHLVVEFLPETSRLLASWYEHADPEIDKRVLGTALENMLAKNSPPQYAGVISTATIGSFALKQIADPITLTFQNVPDGGGKRFSVREWAKHRKGWIFLTNTPETILALRPIQSMWLNNILLKGLSHPAPGSPNLRIVIDETETLHHLAQLVPVLTKGRQYGTSVVIGFQGRSQIKDLYPAHYEAIASQPSTKWLLKTKEPDAGEWMSKMGGAAEYERINESVQTGGKMKGGNSFTTSIINNQLVNGSEFAGLRNRTGYFRYGNHLVKARLPVIDKPIIAESFIPRPGAPLVAKPVMSNEMYADVLRLRREAAEPKKIPAAKAKKPEKPGPVRVATLIEQQGEDEPDE